MLPVLLLHTMMNIEDIQERIFQIRTLEEFNVLSLEIFYHQYRLNPLYRQFVDQLIPDLSSIDHYTRIPFLPIEFFKTHTVITGPAVPERVFYSSGTTGSVPGKHYIIDQALYERSFQTNFELFYGRPEQYVILALLPAYLEREGSSLVYMVSRLIEKSGNPGSGFYLNHGQELLSRINRLRSADVKILLLGVSYALLDLTESNRVKLPKGTIVMETGGMKGRRKEMIRQELHQALCSGLGVKQIHSEYGMTELLSQAYSKAQGKFQTPPWMKILIRDINDPLSYNPVNKSGGINVIDLANLHSCSFIATRDLGRYNEDETFEILGRYDNSDIRGCNLMLDH